MPPNIDLETKPILKALISANKNLALLNGRASSIPNQGILIDTLTLQEAYASSEIENIVTTRDQLFQIEPKRTHYPDPNQKELALYRESMKIGYQNLIDNNGLITINSIIRMFQTLKSNQGGFRKTPGTTLTNDQTGEIVYVPPQHPLEIQTKMEELEHFINNTENNPVDPLVKMALIHHQFESIHPFPDGNGRVGRIINVLYLVQQGLLDIPILYLSRYILRNKDKYYKLLQSTRDSNNWENWIVFMLNAVAETSKETTDLIVEIRNLIAAYKLRLRSDHSKIYSQDLLNNIFRHPYTRIEFVEDELGVSRQTASRYLNALVKSGMLTKVQKGNSIYFINGPLVQRLSAENA